MGKTLYFYVLKEILLYFLICFFFFFFIFFVNQLLLMAEDILSKKAPIKDVALLVFYSFPAILATSAPYAALVGTLMGIGRLVSDREILSMNSLGVTVHALLLPALSAGILISALSFVTNDVLLPAGTIQFNKLYRKILTSTPALQLESNSVRRNKNSIIVTGTIADDLMKGLLIIDTDDNNNKKILSSPDASIVQSTDKNILITLLMQYPLVVLFDSTNKQKYDVINAENIGYNILMKKVLSSYSGNITPREMSSRDLLRELQIKQKENDKRISNIYLMEYQKKFAIPFGAFFFILLAFPLGLSAKINGEGTGFIFGLIIAVMYWALLIGGQTLCMRLGFNGALFMWLPNALVLFVGLLLLGRRVFE